MAFPLGHIIEVITSRIVVLRKPGRSDINSHLDTFGQSSTCPDDIRQGKVRVARQNKLRHVQQFISLFHPRNRTHGFKDQIVRLETFF